MDSVLLTFFFYLLFFNVSNPIYTPHEVVNAYPLPALLVEKVESSGSWQPDNTNGNKPIHDVHFHVLDHVHREQLLIGELDR